jgi:hypothetical protein
MVQTPPKYSEMASRGNPIVESTLNSRYGENNVCWPICWWKDGTIQWYTYERNMYYKINSIAGNRPSSISGKPNYFMDYAATPRIISPKEPRLIPALESQYSCSYDYIVTSPYSTVDLDYVWMKDDHWYALELTTWWVPFISQQKAEYLMTTMNRRPSWQGSNNSLIKQIEGAQDLNCHYIFGCVNTLDRVSNNLKTEGNAYWFDLNKDQVDRLTRGLIPQHAHFGTFHEFIISL